MAITRTATARYEGLGKTGRGTISTQSGALADRSYGFGSRFENDAGTNPEELLAAAHASCFTMALSFALAGEGYTDGTLDSDAAVSIEKDGDGFTVTRSALRVTAAIPDIGEDEFQAIASKAKETCPLSKAIDAEITLVAVLAPAPRA
ncbi:OsmC family protein [Sphingomonas sp.]|uniref:OsmC family protein n=1 Tax=Sphingomonas sp. TaxID=28214 RepID=UPI003B009A39